MTEIEKETGTKIETETERGTEIEIERGTEKEIEIGTIVIVIETVPLGNETVTGITTGNKPSSKYVVIVHQQISHNFYGLCPTITQNVGRYFLSFNFKIKGYYFKCFQHPKMAVPSPIT